MTAVPWLDAGPDPDDDEEPKPHQHIYRWSDIAAEKMGGPVPRCRLCGEEAPR